MTEVAITIDENVPNPVTHTLAVRPGDKISICDSVFIERKWSHDVTLRFTRETDIITIEFK